MKSAEMISLLLATVILAGVRPAGADTAVSRLTQPELNSLVERDGLKFIHRDDLISWIASCKDLGATDAMFAAAYSELALQNMNADETTEAAEKCRKALSLIPSFMPDATQLSNVVYIAENALSDKVRREAVWTYYSRTRGTDAFMIPFGMRQVTGGIRYGIWDWRLSVSKITEPVIRLANNDRAAAETRRSVPDEMRTFNFAVLANNNLGASD